MCQELKTRNMSKVFPLLIYTGNIPVAKAVPLELLTEILGFCVQIVGARALSPPFEKTNSYLRGHIDHCYFFVFVLVLYALD